MYSNWPLIVDSQLQPLNFAIGCPRDKWYLAALILPPFLAVCTHTQGNLWAASAITTYALCRNFDKELWMNLSLSKLQQNFSSADKRNLTAAAHGWIALTTSWLFLQHWAGVALLPSARPRHLQKYLVQSSVTFFKSAGRKSDNWICRCRFTFW